MSQRQLSARDSSILDLIFDPSQCEKEVKEVTIPVNDEVDQKDKHEGDSTEVLRSKSLEVEGVKLTEAGKLDDALRKFNESVEIASQRPSPYNNRAQLYRFMEKDERKRAAQSDDN
jgi:hypothetical protein